MTDIQDDAELYDDAKSTFADMSDLDGRLVAIWHDNVSGQRVGSSGKPYTWVETLTLVLDGEPTELLPEIPYQLVGFQHSTTGLVARLRGREKSDKAMLGRINSRPSSINKNVPAYSIATPTDEDRAIFREHAALVRQIMAERKAAKDAEIEPVF